MKVLERPLAGVLLIEPRTFKDSRGFFLETYNEKKMAEFGIREHFVQDNHSSSSKNVLRGLHYQIEHPQGKLVRAIEGEIFDVGVDMRSTSPTFGRWYGAVLSGENNHLLWIPAGFAHGFQVISNTAHVLYKTLIFIFRSLNELWRGTIPSSILAGLQKKLPSFLRRMLWVFL